MTIQVIINMICVLQFQESTKLGLAITVRAIVKNNVEVHNFIFNGQLTYQ